MGHGVAVPWNDEDRSEGMGRVGAKRDESAKCLFRAERRVDRGRFGWAIQIPGDSGGGVG